MELKTIYFAKFKHYWLTEKLKNLRMNVAECYANRKLLEKSFSVMSSRVKRSQQIFEMCLELTNKHHSLKNFLRMSTLEASTTKLIYAVYHDRIKSQRKYFHKFLFHKMQCGNKS